MRAFSATAVLLLFGFLGRVLSAPFSQYSTRSENPEFFITAIEKAHAIPTVDGVRAGDELVAGIVNHHLLAADFIGQFFLELAKRRQPETFILLGPNHQSRGLHPIAVSQSPWKTPFGYVKPDTGLIRLIRTETGIPVDERSFFNEHSVGALVPFIKKIFPRARVVPIIVKPNLGPEIRERLVSLFYRILERPGCFLILSMDFSHNKPAAEARSEDGKSIAAIKNFDTDHRRLQTLDVDCPQGLEIILRTMKILNAPIATILQHQHSASLLGRPEAPGTSYCTLFFGRGGTETHGQFLTNRSKPIR